MGGRGRSRSAKAGSTTEPPPERVDNSESGEACTDGSAIDSDRLVLALVEALSNPDVVVKLNRDAIDYEKISDLVTQQVNTLMTPLINKLKEKDEEIKVLKSQYEDIRERCDELEQYSRKNSIRISGIPQNPNADDTFAIVLNVCNKIMKVDPPVRLEDISNCHRVGAPEKSDRPILVKFMNYQIRSRVFKAKKKLKDFNKRVNRDPEAADDPDDDPDEDPSNSDATPDVPGNLPLFPNKIYINEDLCKGRAYLSFKARQIKNADGIADTWTFNGKIMVKDKKNKIHKVTRMSELLKFEPRR